jgi:hypothetical protein
VRRSSLRPTFGEYVPADLDEGILYVSLNYATAVHLCACGCRSKVVTPLGPVDWQIIFDGTVSLRPSIGNGQLPCRSHYHIRQNRILWAREMCADATRTASERDRAALRDLHPRRIARPAGWRRCLAWVRNLIKPETDQPPVLRR